MKHRGSEKTTGVAGVKCSYFSFPTSLISCQSVYLDEANQQPGSKGD